MEQKILFNRMRAYREPRISEEQEDRPESESSSSNEENLRESLSDDSIEIVPQPESIYPEHMEQVDFMGLFGVGTHEFHDHMVKKRSTRGKCAAARPYFYMPVDADHRKKQKNKEKYLNWKVTTRKTKPRDSQNGKQRKDKMKVLNKSRSADEMCNQTPRQCPKSSKKPVTTVSRN
nr:uncharacterized protein LOC111509832 isoform X2 [Leptinotarsa decemlineata]